MRWPTGDPAGHRLHASGSGLAGVCWQHPVHYQKYMEKERRKERLWNVLWICTNFKPHKIPYKYDNRITVNVKSDLQYKSLTHSPCKGPGMSFQLNFLLSLPSSDTLNKSTQRYSYTKGTGYM